MICASCSTTRPSIVVKPEVVERKVPAALLKPCHAPQRQIVVTGDIVDLLTATRGALSRCDSQITGIRKWDGGDIGR